MAADSNVKAGADTWDVKTHADTWQGFVSLSFKAAMGVALLLVLMALFLV